MGLIRFVLAMVIVLGHLKLHWMVWNKVAVQLFFMISGFLISYVLIQKKSYKSVLDFYVSRALRIYPIYLVVAFLTLTAMTIAALLGLTLSFFEFYAKAPLYTSLLVAFSNISIFMQDWFFFMSIHEDQLALTIDYRRSDLMPIDGLLVPQAWSLGLELMFYLIAPFVLPRPFLIFFLMVVSILIRYGLCLMDVCTKDPWTYQFFPTELLFFLGGTLSHQFFARHGKPWLLICSVRGLTYAVTFLFAGVLLLFQQITLLDDPVRTILLFIVFFTILPVLFVHQVNCTWDAKLGELSYPIYVSHMLVIYLVTYGMEKIGIRSGISVAVASVLMTIVTSILLNNFIAQPVEKLRARYRRVTS